jgi:hypothetical protein
MIWTVFNPTFIIVLVLVEAVKLSHSDAVVRCEWGEL